MPVEPREPLRTTDAAGYGLDDLLRRKQAYGLATSVVIPARNEAATVAGVVGALAPLRDAGLVDELVVIDSLSVDDTAAVARAAGATVVHVADVHPAVAALPGKGEAMWRGLLATTGDLVAFCDADVLDALPTYALGLLGTMLVHEDVHLVKGFYRRPIVAEDGTVEEHGGRVTELTARPFLNLYRPELGAFVQPLAGEWSGRRSLLETLSFPVGYGVEIGVLLDAHAAVGLAGMAQCDLGVRTHRRQSQQALGVMAAQGLAAAGRRVGIVPVGDAMRQFGIDDHAPTDTALAILERPPASTLLA